MKFLLDDGDEPIGGYGGGIRRGDTAGRYGGEIRRGDTAHQICVFTALSLVPRNFLIRMCYVLLDPFEEQLDLPPILVKHGDGQGR